jgi:hypothetical protein
MTNDDKPKSRRVLLEGGPFDGLTFSVSVDHAFDEIVFRDRDSQHQRKHVYRFDAWGVLGRIFVEVAEAEQDPESASDSTTSPDVFTFVQPRGKQSQSKPDVT